MEAIRGAAIKVGDLVFDEANDKFQRVVATGGEQGSGPRPERAWLAYENNPRIAEIDPYKHYVVRREVSPSKEIKTDADDEEAETSPATFEVICQEWEESERGWGTRPDGYSLHLTIEDRNAWVKEHYDRHTGPVPDEYSRVCGKPRMLRIDAETHERLLARKQEGFDALYVSKVDRSKLRSIP